MTPLFPLHRPEVSERDRNRILQILTDHTKRDAHQVCLAMGFHQGVIARGHLMPKSWLRQLSVAGHVYVFAQLPISGFWRDPEHGLNIPRWTGVDVAATGRFTCEEHEKLFGPIDSVNPNLRDSRTLNLMVYKPILAGSWQKQLLHKAWAAVLAAVPGDEAFEKDIRNCSQQMIGLEHYQREIEQCLNPPTCRRCQGQACKVVGHVVRHMPGSPAIVVSQFSDGIRMRLDAFRGTLQPIANWGITVLPTERGHSVVLHYFREETNIMHHAIDKMHSLNGRRLQEYVSSLILDNCENIAISPKAWNTFGTKKQQAITERFISELAALSYGPLDHMVELEARRLNPESAIPNPRQINLFNMR